MKGPHHRLELSVQSRDHHLEVVDVIQVQATHQRVVLSEPALQRPRQIRNLGAHLALGQISEHFRAAFPVDERLDHRPGATWW